MPFYIGSHDVGKRGPFDINFSAVGDEYKADVDFIKEKIKCNKVVIFGKPWETDTRFAKYIFKEHGQKYCAVEMDRIPNEVALENILYKITGGHTLLPYIFINGKYMGSRQELLVLTDDELKNILAEPYSAE